jgi:hypothetical protein
MQGETLFICDEIGEHRKSTPQIERSKRIGVNYAEEAKNFLYRFIAQDVLLNFGNRSHRWINTWPKYYAEGQRYSRSILSDLKIDSIAAFMRR